MLRFPTYLLIFFVFALHAQATWQPLNILSNGNNQRFDDVFFLNETTGWAANGFFAAVYKTTDGGTTWVEQLNEANLAGNYYFRNIEFLNENIGFLGTLNNDVFKTVDGGENWTVINNISPNPAAICGLEAVGTSTVYGCGAYFSPAYIIKSTDSGATWTHTDMTAHANALVELNFLTEDIGFAAGRSDNGGTILKTTDGGASWTEIFNSNIAGEYVWKLQVLESNTNVMFGSVTAVSPNMGKLIKSIDGGVTWTSFDAPETDIQAVGFINENRGWMGGFTTGFYETNNGGQTWTNINVGNNLNRIFIINSALAYAGGTSLYKFSEETLSTNTLPDAARNPLNVILKNNPVKSTLEFDVEFLDDDNILIELYDIHGKFIKQLIRDRTEFKATKTYSFSVENLQSGSYLINLHNNTGRQSHKFIKL